MITRRSITRRRPLLDLTQLRALLQDEPVTP